MGKTIVAGGGRATVPISGIKASELSVGSVVKLMENGVAAEYLVVNQGIPSGSNLYDASCDGTWLLRKDCYESRQWHSSDSNSYKASTIHSYLNSTFMGLFDSVAQSAIKEAKIPYVNGTGSSSVASGANGLSAHIFLLGGYEVGWTQSDNKYIPIDGAKLDYFVSGGDDTARIKRTAYFNGSVSEWWLRSPKTLSADSAWGVTGGEYYGYPGGTGCNGLLYVRPALILPSNALFDKNTLILKGVA